jgi:hypothetical protein
VGVLPSSTSGAVNAGEPVMIPVAVRKPPAILAMPKSVSSGSPYSVNRMFSRLDVTVQDARAMGGVKRTGELYANAQRLTPIQRAMPTDQRLE